MARCPRRAAGGEEFIRGLVQSNSFVIAKVCTERPRGLSVGFASEFFLSGSVHPRRSRPGGDAASAMTTKRTAELGISKNGKTCVVSCVRNHATTP
jgi:hypothetical protein